MNPNTLSAAMLLAAATLCAQQPDAGLRYTIKTKSEVATTRQVLVDGEEMRGNRRFGGGDGTPAVTTSTVVFDEGKSDAGVWRRYHKASAALSRQGRDAEPMETDVASSLEGKQIYFDAKGKAFENDAKGEALDERVALGIPTATDLAGLVPEDLVVDAEFAIDDGFRSALGSLVHPIRADRTRPGDDQPGERRRPGGQEREEPQPPGREEPGAEDTPRRPGGERGDRMRRPPAAVRDAALMLLANDKLTWSGKGRVTEIQEMGDERLAHITFQADAHGEGDIAELGLQQGMMMGGRRGRGGDAQPTGKGSAELKLEGEIVVETATRTVRHVKVAGDVASTMESVFVREMRGRESEIETHAETAGKLTVEVACEPMPHAEPTK